MVRNKNIMVTGASGQLGTQLKKIENKFQKFNFFFFDKNQLDISNFLLFKQNVKDLEIDYIINCAAYTDVIKSEDNRQLAEIVNSISVEKIARICFEENVRLIHISTDYVFNGEKKSKYVETDITNPINFYGLTKLNGEKNIFKYNLKQSIIIRTSWLYSELENNFVSKILSKINSKIDINVIDNEFGCPTNSMDLALTILEIIPKLNNAETEVYHYCNNGICSRYELAKEINSIANGESKIIPTNFYDYKIKRPKNSGLNTSKIVNKYNIEIKDWKDSLHQHFISLGIKKLM